jgi:hypothetical protein
MVRRIPARKISAPERESGVMDLRSEARRHTKTCLRVLSGIVRSPKCHANSRIAAASVILDRGWGKAPQTHEIEANHAINIIIRKVLDEPDDEQLIDSDALLIEGDVVSDKT